MGIFFFFLEDLVIFLRTHLKSTHVILKEQRNGTIIGMFSAPNLIGFDVCRNRIRNSRKGKGKNVYIVATSCTLVIIYLK